MGVIKRLWRGEYSLGVAFWGFYFAGFVVLVFMMEIIFPASYRFDIDTPPGVLVVRAAYFVLSSVGVWRSARKNIASAIWLDRLWGYSARVLVFGIAVQAIWGILAPLLGWTAWYDAIL